MALAVRFRPEARTEAWETRAWYDGRKAGLGDAFTTALAETVGSIAENPLRFPRVLGEIRRAILNRFPYAVYFRTTDTEIVVLAVHGRQDPGHWRSRL